jgi:MarR family transcriptional regulator for hemolysin
MEREGLVTRRRDPNNRRVHLVELTKSGEALFFRLLDTVIAFDEHLRRGLGDADLSRLRRLLNRLGDNVSFSEGVRPDR